MKLKRITPRTCLWPLTGSILVTFGLSIGLTFRSNHHCYAGVCGEWLFPLQARLHVIVWYCWISLSVAVIALRAFRPPVQSLLQRQILHRSIPVVGKSLTLSGVLIAVWILALYGIITGIWWVRLQDYFVDRGQQGGVMGGNHALAAIALTGHYADVTMGMVLLPVSRNSALASFFRLSASTTSAFHIIQAYVLFAMTVIHGLLYASWTATYYSDAEKIRNIFPLLNPTYLYNEVWPGNQSPLGVWRASLVFTGLVATSIMTAMFITTFPIIRRKHFNVFYFTHLLSILAVVTICLHASTMFYTVAPGLAMWILDWGMRVYELSGKMDSSLAAVGNGWFCLTVPLPRRRLDGCACHSPLAHFHIHHTQSSIREIHPFTTITHLASQKVATPSSTSKKVLSLSETSDETTMIQFLFRKSETDPTPSTPPGDHLKKKQPSSKQWTNKLASLVDEASIPPPSKEAQDPENAILPRPSPAYAISLRLEGPYFTAANPAAYDTAICLVAGTGISGAIAIAAAFSAQSSASTEEQIAPPAADPDHPAKDQGVPRSWKRCVIVWSIRESDHISLPFFDKETPGLEVRTHLTGKGHQRLDHGKCIGEIIGGGGGGNGGSEEGEESGGGGVRTWVYLSGPNPFIEAGERACRERGVDYFGARWA